jgi:putative ABC transport system permease protein
MSVIGVIKDFHFESLHIPINPMVMLFQPELASYLSVRIQTNNIGKTVGFIQEKWKSFVPDVPFTYSFLDKDFERLYRAERQVSQIFFIFSMLAICIACLGLFGLTAFTASQRRKEIGIRKIHGASVPGIMLMLARDFTKWVLLANLIAWPVAYLVMAKWLENFAYRTQLGWSAFVISGLLALIIAVFTVSYQSIKAARANPIDSLRYE